MWKRPPKIDATKPWGHPTEMRRIARAHPRGVELARCIERIECAAAAFFRVPQAISAAEFTAIVGPASEEWAAVVGGEASAFTAANWEAARVALLSERTAKTVMQ